MPTTNNNENLQCTYCQMPIKLGDKTEDHVIARSWYPDNTPPTAKWKVIACKKCNNEFSSIEKDVLERLALCLDPTDPTVASITAGAQRAMNPKSGKNPRDCIQRLKKRQAILRTVKPINTKDEVGVLPFGSENFDLGSRTGILIPGAKLRAVIKKWIQGVHLCEIGILGLGLIN